MHLLDVAKGTLGLLTRLLDDWFNGPQTQLLWDLHPQRDRVGEIITALNSRRYDVLRNIRDNRTRFLDFHGLLLDIEKKDESQRGRKRKSCSKPSSEPSPAQSEPANGPALPGSEPGSEGNASKDVTIHVRTQFPLAPLDLYLPEDLAMGQITDIIATKLGVSDPLYLTKLKTKANTTASPDYFAVKFVAQLQFDPSCSSVAALKAEAKQLKDSGAQLMTVYVRDKREHFWLRNKFKLAELYAQLNLDLRTHTARAGGSLRQPDTDINLEWEDIEITSIAAPEVHPIAPPACGTPVVGAEDDTQWTEYNSAQSSSSDSVWLRLYHPLPLLDLRAPAGSSHEELSRLIRLAIGNEASHVYLVQRELGYSSKPLRKFKVHSYTPLVQFNPASTAQEREAEEARLRATGAWSVQLSYHSKTTKYWIPSGTTIAELLA